MRPKHEVGGLWPYGLVGLSVGLLASAVVLWVTARYGAFVTSGDEVNYFVVSNSLLAGNGTVDDYGQLVNHWPPFYPVAVACSSLISGLDVHSSGRYLNALLAFLYVASFSAMSRRLEIRTYTFVIILCPVVLFTSPFGQFFYFESDAMALVGWLCVLLIIYSWETQKKAYLLPVIGALLGCLFLTRYAVLGLAVGFFFALLIRKSTAREKLRWLLRAVAPFLLFPVIWAGYAMQFEQSMTDRVFAFHPIQTKELLLLAETCIRWFLPLYTKPLVLLFAVLTIPYWLYLKSFRNCIKAALNPHRSFVNSLLVIAGTYILFLFCSVSFFDASTPLNSRILAPVLPIFLLIAAPIMDSLIRHKQFRISTIAISAIVVVVTGLHSFGGWRELSEYGQGYTGSTWSSSPVIEKLKNSHAKKIYSNGSDVIRFSVPAYLGKAHQLPGIENPHSQKTNMHFDREWAMVRSALQSGEAAAVYFDRITWRKYLPDKKALVDACPLCDTLSFKDGLIIFHPTLSSKFR